MKKEKLISKFKSAICLLLCAAIVLPLAGCKGEVKDESPVADEESVISQKDDDKPIDEDHMETVSEEKPNNMVLISEKTYTSDGILESMITHEYNELGLIQSSTSWSKSIYSTEDTSLYASNTICYQYDSSGNLIRESDYDDSFGSSVCYVYDDNGKLISETHDMSGSTVEYEYDNNGNILNENRWVDSAYLNSSTEYTYDENGNLLTNTDYWYFDDGTVRSEGTKYIYDEEGHLLSKTSIIDGEIYEDEGSTYTYDDSWNLIKEEHLYCETLISTTYSYDENNRVISEQTDDFGYITTTTYTYDDYGNILTKTHNDQSQTIYTYREISTTESDTSWKQSYLSYIQSKQSDYSEDTTFHLVDIDGNNIPELFINCSIYATGSELCTFYAGNMNTMYLRGWGSLSYIPDSGLVLNTSGHHGMMEDSVYLIENGQISEIAAGSYTDIDSMSYIWNGIATTNDAYKESLNETFDSSQAKEISTYIDIERLDSEEIVSNVYYYEQIISVLS